MSKLSRRRFGRDMRAATWGKRKAVGSVRGSSRAIAAINPRDLLTIEENQRGRLCAVPPTRAASGLLSS